MAIPTKVTHDPVERVLGDDPYFNQDAQPPIKVGQTWHPDDEESFLPAASPEHEY